MGCLSGTYLILVFITLLMPIYMSLRRSIPVLTTEAKRPILSVLLVVMAMGTAGITGSHDNVDRVKSITLTLTPLT